MVASMSGKMFESALRELSIRGGELLTGADHFLVVYGSSAIDDLRKSNSDLDFFVIVKEADERLKRKFVDLAISLHKKYQLNVDEAVPYDKKVFYTTSDYSEAMRGAGFRGRDGRLIIECCESHEYLKSEAMRYRLLVTAIATRNVLKLGDERKFSEMRGQAWRLLRDVVRETQGGPISAQKLQRGRVLQGGRSVIRSYKEYLGFPLTDKFESYIDGQLAALTG